MSLSPALQPKHVAMPRVYIITDSYGSSDDDPFASRDEDRYLLSQSGESLDEVADFGEMKKIYQKMLDMQELEADEGKADWSLQEAQKKQAERHMAKDGVNNHALEVKRTSNKCIDYSNALQPR